MDILAAALCITAVCVGARIPLVFCKSSDQWLTYLLLRTNSSKPSIDLEIPRAVQGEAIMPYPPLPHFLASRLPERFWKLGAYAITYLSDAIVAFLLFLALMHTLSQSGYSPAEAYACSLAAALSLCCLPSLIPVTSRVRAPNGRALGFLLSTLYFIALWAALHLSPWFVLCALPLAFLIVLASKFALQAVFFFSPLMALFTASPVLLVPPAAVALVSVLRPKSIWASICVDKIVHALRYKVVGSSAEYRNLFPNFLLYFKLLRKDYRWGAMMLRYWSPLLIALVSIPYAFVSLALPLIPQVRAAVFADPVLSFCYFLTLSAGIVFAVTSVGFCRVFGQSERYFEYASPFIILFFVLTLAKAAGAGPALPFFMLGLNVALLLFLHISTNFPYMKRIAQFDFEQDDDLAEVHRYLAGMDGAKVGAVPIKMTYMLMGMAAKDELENISYYHPTIATVPVRISDFRLKRDAFALPFIFVRDPEWVRETFGIDTWVEDTAFTDANAEQPFVQALKKHTPIFTAGKYRVYRIQD